MTNQDSLPLPTHLPAKMNTFHKIQQEPQSYSMFGNEYFSLNNDDSALQIQDKYAHYELGMYNSDMNSVIPPEFRRMDNMFMTTCNSKKCSSNPVIDAKQQQRFLESVMINTDMSSQGRRVKNVDKSIENKFKDEIGDRSNVDMAIIVLLMLVIFYYA